MYTPCAGHGVDIQACKRLNFTVSSRNTQSRRTRSGYLRGQLFVPRWISSNQYPVNPSKESVPMRQRTAMVELDDPRRQIDDDFLVACAGSTPRVSSCEGVAG
jgi:hypothetical protein